MNFTVDGRRVGAETKGRGPARVILIHGAAGRGSAWAGVMEGLDSALAPDLPGHGDSDGPALASVEDVTDWLAALMDMAGIERAVVGGHSLGGLVALEMAARHPGRVEGLALISNGAAMPVHPDLLRMAEEDPAAAVGLMVKWGFPPDCLKAEAARSLMESAPKGSLHADLAACAAYQNGFEAAARVTCPAKLAGGGLDKMCRPDAVQALASAIPGAQALILPEFGHMLPWECPERLVSEKLFAR